MSGNKPRETPTDRSTAEELARQKAEEEARKKEAEAKAAWEQTIGSAYSNAVADANDYFTEQGLDPTVYANEINAAATKAKGLIPQGATDLVTPFQDIGQNVYERSENEARNRFMRKFDDFAPTGFERRELADTADDATLDAINAEQFGSAEKYLRNLLDRGVITTAGYDAGRRDLDTQGYRARAQLSEAGDAALATQRAQIGNIANQGRNAAANYKLGTTFDPFSYDTDINNSIASFFSNLGGNVRNRLTAPLYSTAGLPAIAGAAQGAQNTRFDPNALAGIFSTGNQDDDDEEDQYVPIF